jgi:serine/threonine protein kinase
LDRAVLETASDRYVIVEYLAEGGMGAIYLGKKLGVDGFEKEVVLKQLLPEYTQEPKFIDLFLREAKLSASLDHANIVRTVDLVNAGDDYFMVMEYVRGGDLRTLMRRARRRHQRFSPQAAVFIGHELLEALAYAHAKTRADGRPLHLIHRDVSPSNILVSGAGEVKLTDFGIAKANTHRSVFYKVKGKVGYMSPEQARGEPVDHRSDLFSLGVVLYEVLVGERLFVGDLLSTASMIYSQRISPPSRKRPPGEVPPEIDEVIMQALSLTPSGRFQSAEEMQEALGRAASRTRLLCGASEMASHLKQVCGEDPSTWLKLETLGFEESHAIAHGTAVLSGVDDNDPFDDSRPHRERPALAADVLAKKELTSVVALRGDEIELISDSESQPLAPLAPTRSEPHGKPMTTPTPTPTAPFARELARRHTSFEQEDSQTSRAATLVRSGELRGRSPTGEQTLVRLPGDGLPAASASAQASADTIDRPPPVMTTPLYRPEARPEARAAPETRPLPPPAPMVRKRRLLPLILILLLIGIGVALGVAFSGPELEVVDPVLPGQTPAQAAPAAPAPSELPVPAAR